LKLNTRIIRQLLPIFLTLLILFETAAYVSMTPRPTDKFFQLYVLGSNGTADNYYPNNSSYLKVGENVNWQVGVVNDMGSVQLVAIRVKLGNLTIDAPNDTLATPSPAPMVAEFRQFMQDNGTWEMPFSWEVANFTTTPDGHILTLELMINNATYVIQNPPSCIAYSCSFRMILELWTWSTSVANFQFSWLNDDQQEIAWLQLWFNLAPGGSSR
jgi:hypothetical protein